MGGWGGAGLFLLRSGQVYWCRYLRVSHCLPDRADFRRRQDLSGHGACIFLWLDTREAGKFSYSLIARSPAKKALSWLFNAPNPYGGLLRSPSVDRAPFSPFFLPRGDRGP